MTKRITFNCSECYTKASKTAPNYYKQIKKLGQPLCSSCAKSSGIQKTKLAISNRYPIKNSDIVVVTCSCGKQREISFKQSKTNSLCLECASRLNYTKNRNAYAREAAKRIGNHIFAAKVAAGLAKVPAAIRKSNSVAAAAALWQNEERKAAEIERRQTKEWSKTLSKALKDVNLLTTAEFVARASAIHDGLYDYSETTYSHSKDQIVIVCPAHGRFYQRAADHLYHENGCQKCAASREMSKPHRQINEYVESIGYKPSINDRSHGFEIDILINNVGIEHHGLYWHSYDSMESKKDRYSHHHKASLAEARNIRLYQVFEHEWRAKRRIVESMIANALGHSEPIDARKCDVALVDDLEPFFTANHIQGHRPALIGAGLYFDNSLVMAISISKHQQYGYELIRSATTLGKRVRGGLSRLITFCHKVVGLQSLMTYADRRFSIGNAYKQCGFTHLGITKPNYWYTKGGAVYSRQQFQKAKLNKILPHFDPTASESVNMFANGYRRLWDAGHYKLLRKA